MKLLMLYCNSFGFKPAVKTLDEAEIAVSANLYRDCEVAFIQVEEEDTLRAKEVEKKLLKNLKWACGKNNVSKIVLHSFAHLSESKADPAFTKSLFDSAEERLRGSGFEVSQTPFGYFLDLQVDTPGFSLARIFKSI